MLEEALLRTIVRCASQSRQPYENRDFALRSLWGNVQVEGHLATCGLRIVGKFEEFAAERGYCCGSFDRHDCGLDEGEKMKLARCKSADFINISGVEILAEVNFFDSHDVECGEIEHFRAVTAPPFPRPAFHPCTRSAVEMSRRRNMSAGRSLRDCQFRGSRCVNGSELGTVEFEYTRCLTRVLGYGTCFAR